MMLAKVEVRSAGGSTSKTSANTIRLRFTDMTSETAYLIDHVESCLGVAVVSATGTRRFWAGPVGRVGDLLEVKLYERDERLLDVAGGAILDVLRQAGITYEIIGYRSSEIMAEANKILTAEADESRKFERMLRDIE